jgi:CubicO group peptidase (beta-lactamase class C family)
MLTALLLAATLPSPLAGFETHIERAMPRAGTSALAVAVVQNDKVIYQRSFGTEANQRFYLASVPKSMTALSARLLAEEKKLDLDAPLTTTLPALKLPAPLDPARMSVRDLLTHRLSFENDAVTFRHSYSGEADEVTTFALLEKHSVATSRVFRYDNLGYLLASYAIERAASQPFWTVVRERVLAPVGMQDTSEKPCIDTKSARTMNRGSGGLCSTIGDMTRWLRVNMTDGVLDGKRVIPLSAMRDVHASQITLDRKFGRLQRRAYGLGWYHADYQGDLVLHHFGSYPKAWAHVSWMPDRNIGVVVLANENTPLPDSVAMLAYDTLLGRADAVSRFDAEITELEGFLGKLPSLLEGMAAKIHAEATDSTRALASYVGTYADDAFGTMIVGEKDGVLVATIGDRSAPLQRVRGDTFTVQWFRNEQPERVTFGERSMKWRGRELAKSR